MQVIKKSLFISIILMLICGIIYPLAMTGVSQILFNKQANGSMIVANGKVVGSEVIGQNFTDARFFKGRISNVNYNTYKEEDKKVDKSGKAAYGGVGSGSSNLAPSSKELKERIQKDIDEFLKANPEIKREDIPTDLLTSSASGLDPNISPKAARIQSPVISKATGIEVKKLDDIIDKNTEGRQFGVFGEPRVNVLKANLEIANILKQQEKL